MMPSTRPRGWRYKLYELSKFPEAGELLRGETFKEAHDKFEAEIKALPIYEEHADELESTLDGLNAAAEERDLDMYDNYMSELYQWADYERVWIEPSI
jgi:DNA mismatch repair ATPase MutS